MHKKFSPRYARQFITKNTPRLCFRINFSSGSKFQLSREQGGTKFDWGSTKIYLGEHQENNSGSREKRVKFRREPGVRAPPLMGSRLWYYHKGTMSKAWENDQILMTMIDWNRYQRHSGGAKTVSHSFMHVDIDIGACYVMFQKKFIQNVSEAEFLNN